ncbi:MAG: DUF2808 domain-containing protein [Cyanobium sp.]
MPPLSRSLAVAATVATVGTAALAGGTALLGSLPAPSLAQGTPGLLEFRWDSDKNYRKLYFFMTETARLKRSEYYLILKPKDRKTALLKLSVTIPDYFDSKIEAKNVKLCEMSEGGMLNRTRCRRTIPATVEVSPNGKAIEIFPDTPVSDQKTIGVYINLFNPFNAGMYQFNALGQAPGDIPVSGLLGSWLIQIDPN